MRKFLRWLVGVPVVVIITGFAVANRRWVTLSLDPFSQDAPYAAIDMPLWALLFLGLFFGLVIGWVASWLAQGRHRKALRDSKTELASLQRELADVRREQGSGTSQQQQELAPYQPLQGGFL